MKPARSLSIIIGDRQQHKARQQQQTTDGPLDNNFLHHGMDDHRHKLHTQCSMPCSLNTTPRRATETTYQIHHSLFDEKIIYSQLSIAPKKDFTEEVRALIDVKKFVSEAIILLELNEIRIGSIVERIVDRLVECRSLGDQVAEEAKTLLFVERNSFSMVLSNTMQGLYKSRADGRIAYDHSWIVATCSLSNLNKRQIAIARFGQPVNFGRHSQEVRFLIIVLAPSKEKLTKSAWETGRTFATMFTDIDFRRKLLRAKNQDEFKVELLVKAEALAREHEKSASFEQLDYQLDLKHKQGLKEQFSNDSGNTSTDRSMAILNKKSSDGSGGGGCCTSIGSGLSDDFRRRMSFYVSDFVDGFSSRRSIYKTISTTVFLYFSVLLPCIAFGVVDTNNTDGHIDPKKTMIGQAIGGILFALFSGQPLVVIMTTAPLCIYVKVIYQISQDLEVDFGTFYAAVGLWMAFFLIIMSLTNSSNLMRYCTRSTEDIFALFTAFAFGSDGVKEAIRSFNKYYWEPDCVAQHPTLLIMSARSSAGEPQFVDTMPTAGNISGSNDSTTMMLPSFLSNQFTKLSSANLSSLYSTLPTLMDLNETTTIISNSSLLNQHHPALSGGEAAAATDATSHPDFSTIGSRCQRETCIMYLFLMSGTLFLANSFNAFNETPYLSSRKREIIKDYALAISVLIFSFVGSCLFADIKLDVFEFGEFTGLHLAQLSLLHWRVVVAACLLGFMLSVLFYIDQNICGAMVNNAPYKLKKGDYFHLDLLVLAILNILLSLTGLPWMHGKLPHSHLHSKALADYEERVDDGHVQQMIVNIRETRLTGLLCSLLIALSLLAIPYPLSYIPLPVLSGVFLYTALAEFKSNSMVERICLLFTEQAAYPPNHYIRRCPQRKIHFFTLAQCIQLAVVSFIGFYPNPYVNMAFPLVVATFVPIREFLLPHLIDAKYLNSLDSASME